MNSNSSNSKKQASGALRTIIVIIAVIAAVIIGYAVLGAYLDRHPWIFGGSGTPDIIYLDDGHRLEKVIAFRRNTRVVDVRNDTVIYANDKRYGAVGLSGNIIAQAEAVEDHHETGIGLAFDESENVITIQEQRTAENNSDKPSEVIDAGDGKILCYDIGGLTAVRTNGVLGVRDADTGEVVTMFGGNNSRGSLWRLEEPYFFGEYVVVRIYYCDCIYRTVNGDMGDETNE